MIDIVEQDKTYTLAEYFAMEKASTDKIEYIDGNVINMPGGTARHNEIALKIGAALLYALEEKEKEYKVYNSDMKIQIPAYNYFVYPDAVVISEQPEFYNNRQDIITNPLLIVEVLSPATQKYDRGGKFIAYRTLPSFKEYVIISQDKPLVTDLFRKDVHTWEDMDIEGMDQILHLRSIDCKLPLARIYKGIDFTV